MPKPDIDAIRERVGEFEALSEECLFVVCRPCDTNAVVESEIAPPRTLVIPLPSWDREPQVFRSQLATDIRALLAYIEELETTPQAMEQQADRRTQEICLNKRI